jgi:shikimate dehydrogenase
MHAVLAGLIGINIGKSLSPALFEDACAAHTIRAHYHLVDLAEPPARNLGEVLKAARLVGFTGLNITYPCKEAILPLLDALSDEARQIGAVNTIVIAPDGTTTGFNTDRIGFRSAFEEELGPAAVQGQAAVVVGAGGAGKAVAFALADLGAETLFVSDKSPEQARKLVAAVNALFGTGRARLETDPAAALAKAAGIVNATPVGMLGASRGTPIPTAAITARHWVADVIYTPLETELIKTSAAKGARTMAGAGMCIHQAAETFRLLTGLAPDVARMRRTFAAAAAVRDRQTADASIGKGGRER